LEWLFNKPNLFWPLTGYIESGGYRKIGNNWFIAHEHVSVPVDLQTGKANFIQ
jgi:hypothetical protein